MTDPLICYCGHRHTADSNREDAGCPCNDAHDWAAPRAEGLDVPDGEILAAILEDTPPHILDTAKMDSGEGLAGWIVGHWSEYARLSSERPEEAGE